MIAHATPRGRAPHRPLVVELAGPAGAGKSTLAHALAALATDGRQLAVWGLPRMALLAGAARVVPAALSAARSGRPLSSGELAQMVRIDALRRIVDRACGTTGDVVVLDEGPVFGLSWFEVFHRRNGDPGWAGWRRRAVRAWARRLDAVVYVDAEDAVLASRIRTRAKAHPVKDADDPVITDFTRCFRNAFARVLDELKDAGRVPVLRLRDHTSDPARAAVRLRAALEDLRHGR